MTTQASPSNSSSVLHALSEAGTTLVDRLGPSMVSIGSDGRGTGIVVGPDRVLTNAHHLRDRTTSVTFHTGRSVQGTVIGVDADGDLVVLSVPTDDAVAVEWAPAVPAAGAVVFAVARGGGDLRVSFGLVSGTGRTFRSGTGHVVTGALELSANLARGSSGGPVVDTDGRVVAITTRRERSGFALARPFDDALRARVADLAAGRSTARRRLGVVLASEAVATHLRTSVGLSARPGLLVRAVEPASPAANAGVAVGDLLVEAAGVALAAASDLHEVLSSADDRVVLTVVRGDTERQVTVSFGSEAAPLGEPDLSA